VSDDSATIPAGRGFLGIDGDGLAGAGLAMAAPP